MFTIVLFNSKTENSLNKLGPIHAMAYHISIREWGGSQCAHMARLQDMVVFFFFFFKFSFTTDTTDSMPAGLTSRWGWYWVRGFPDPRRAPKCKTQNSGLLSKEEKPRDPINQPSRWNTKEGLLSVVPTGDSDLLGGRAPGYGVKWRKLVTKQYISWNSAFERNKSSH